MRRLIVILVAVGTGTVLSACPSSSMGFSYRDGEAFAQSQIQQGNPLLVNAKAECDSLVADGSVPSNDDKGQWEAGCEAALANADFVGGSTGTG